jgi:hypothetical protein
MGIDRSRIRPFGAPFRDIMPGKQAIPLWHIDLPVTFGDPTNYKMKTLTFEVVGFHGSYHATLGQSYYPKFMAIPQDAGPAWGYQHRLLFPVCLPVQGGELNDRLSDHHLRGTRSHPGGNRGGGA